MTEHHGHSPLTQFEVYPLIPFKLGSLDLSFTNASLWMMIAIAAITVLMLLGIRNRQLVPGRWQSVSEVLVQFVRDTVSDTAGREALKYFPFIFSLFMFILIANLTGLLPYSFTSTSHIIVTFALASSVFIGCTAIAIIKHGPVKFIHYFLPHGVPMALLPLMFVIELMSYLCRPVSLSLRLGINMMVGHILMKIVASFIFVLGVWGASLFVVLVGLTGFEFCVAILQAYIFTILTCIYLHDAIHLH